LIPFTLSKKTKKVNYFLITQKGCAVGRDICTIK